VSDSPGVLAFSVAFSLLNASVSDEAANTLSEPLSVPVPPRDEEAVDEVDPDEEPDDLLLLPQAAARNTNNTADGATALRETRDIRPPGSTTGVVHRRFVSDVVDMRLVTN
jgi:hypothetical protein